MHATRIERDDIEAARRQRAAPGREEMLGGVHEGRTLSRTRFLASTLAAAFA